MVRLVNGEWVDEDVHDPLASMFNFLNEKREKALAQQWGLWLLKYDQEKAMKVRDLGHHASSALVSSKSQLLLTIGLGKRSAKGGVEESALLRRIQETDPSSGTQFLENLVLTKRNAVRGPFLPFGAPLFF